MPLPLVSAPLVSVPTGPGLWERVFLPAPLVVVATVEPDGRPDLAPKHMVVPLGFDGWLGFVCTPRHATWRNAERTGAFTVSWPRPEQLVQASLSASPRLEDGSKPGSTVLATEPAVAVEGVVLAQALLAVECSCERLVEGFGEHGLVVGRIQAARAAPEALRGMDRDEAELIRDNPVLVYLHPTRIAEVRTTHAFPFPLGFSR